MSNSLQHDSPDSSVVVPLFNEQENIHELHRRLRAALNVWQVLLTYVVGSLAIEILMSMAVEWPILRLRDRFFPSRA